jgi:O-methyltransferase domain
MPASRRLPCRTFGLSDLGQTLRSDVSGSMRDYVALLGQPESWRAWEHLEHSIMSGGPAFEHVFRLPLFQYLAANPSAGRMFDQGMRSRGRTDDDAIAAAYDFSSSRRIVDVAGGVGRLLLTILKTAPQADGVLFDVPGVAEAARKSLLRSETGHRIEIVSGNFFDRVPEGADLYLLKQVLHDWDDERAVRLLTNCRCAMTATSRLLICEMVVRPYSIFPQLLDLMMLVWTGGRERALEQYDQLLMTVGLRLDRVVRTKGLICILEAVRAGD